MTCTASSLVCLMPLQHGDWTLALSDRATGTELPLPRTGWLGSAGRAYSAVSEASIVIDPDLAVRLDRQPRRWLDEVVLRRDGFVQWLGPIQVVDDDPTEGVVWTALDRMALVMERRPFWRTATYQGDTANLMSIALDAADYGDPVGLRRDPRLTGVTAEMPVVAGDKVGDAIDALDIGWTVIADTVRYGRIDTDSELVLPPDAWGDDRPRLTADGFAPLTHVIAATTNNGRVFYPSADPNDRPPGTPLLVDTIDVGDVSSGAARDLARQAWLDRQGDIAIIADERRPLNERSPLQWNDLEPGTIVRSTAEGFQLAANEAPIRIGTVTADINDSRESSVTANLTEARGSTLDDPYLHDLADLPGIAFPDAEVYPLDQLDGIDWATLGLVDNGEFSVGGLSGPAPGFDPLDFGAIDGPIEFPGIDPLNTDPFADCPPAHCCDQCATGGGGPTGGSGFYIRDVGTQDFHTLKSSPIVLCGEEFGVFPNYAPGDLLVAHGQGNNDAASISFDAGSGWTEYVNGEHDAAIVLVAAARAEPASFDIVWPEAEDTAVDGQMVAIAGAGDPHKSAFKDSDVDGFSGSSTLPQVTTEIDGCILLYGTIGSGNEIGDVTAPGLKRLRFNQFDQFCVMFWERQETAGLTPARTITYPGPEFRTEWIIAIPPAGA